MRLQPLRPLLARPQPLLKRPYSTPHVDLQITDYPAPHTGSIKLLLLARPQTRNALSVSLVDALASTISALPSSSTRALVIASSSPKSFCAGADLKERLTFSPSQTAAFLSKLRKTFTDLENLKIPTISAISGMALGGGLELALATDFRVLGSRAQVGLPETRLGIIPGAGGTYRLPRIVGKGKAMDLVLTGRRVTASEALAIGLADRFVMVEGEEGGAEGKQGGRKDGLEDEEGREKVIEAALEMAREICAGGPLGVLAAKEAVRGAAEEVENGVYETVVGTEDRDEALKAFAEKRKPVFKGR